MKNVLAINYSLRKKRLNTLGFETYEEYLKSDLWKQVKSKFYKKKRSKMCFCCGKTDEKMIPHHIHYKKLTKIMLGGLVAVCRSCHQKIHDYHKAHKNLSIEQATKRLKVKITKYGLAN